MTHIAEIDQIILMHLPINALKAVQQVNHYLNDISMDEHFWKQKCLQDFGPITCIKPADIAYEKYYHQLHQNKYPQIKHADDAAGAGRISELIWLFQHNIQPTHRGANFAARNADLNTLKWLASINVYADIIGANWAASRNHLKIIQWLAKHDIYPDIYGVRTAVKNNCHEVVNWLISLLP